MHEVSLQKTLLFFLRVEKTLPTQRLRFQTIFSKLDLMMKEMNKMAKDKKDATIRKRQLIAKANRTMFVTVAVAAAIVGIASVLGTFLVREMLFNAKVIGAQDKSISNLKSSITNTQELETKLKSLQTNSSLLSSRANNEDNALRVILDALPASENTAALGASLSDRLLNVPGIEIDSITVNTAAASTNTGETTSSAVATETSPELTTDQATGATPQSIEFSFSVTSSSPNNILNVIQNMEKSIRTINIKTFRIEQNKDSMTLSVTAQAYYLSQANIELKTEAIKSDDTKSTTTSSDAASGSTTTGGE